MSGEPPEFLVTRDTAAPTITLALGDVAHVIYNFTHPSNLDISLLLRYNGRDIHEGLSACSLGNQFGFYFIRVENSTCSTDEHHLFLLRIDGSMLTADSQTVECVVTEGRNEINDNNTHSCGGNTSLTILRNTGKET